MIKAFMASCLLSMLITAPSSGNARFGGEGYYSLGAFTSPQSKRSGVELSGLYFWQQRDFTQALKVSALVYQARYTEADIADNYWGFSAAWQLHAKGDIAPYVGLGIFSGERQDCINLSNIYDDDDYYDSYHHRYECDGAYVLAIYPEVGITLKTKHLQVSPFVRRYFDTHGSDTPSNTYGISVGIRF
ncbi:hypothetical protein QX776_04615 [Alteromonadaceae bacterium BrNp21-10]|nr:hypothetical protein [Alteromonadaceae bacterium BrNp21-10]